MQHRVHAGFENRPRRLQQRFQMPLQVEEICRLCFALPSQRMHRTARNRTDALRLVEARHGRIRVCNRRIAQEHPPDFEGKYPLSLTIEIETGHLQK